MSYKETFRRTVAVHYSGSVRYPASQQGGSVSYSGTAYEDVNIEILVDTRPFDSSINGCNKSINVLTASVGAMSAAQCKAIAENAKKVSKTIIDGFFHVVRTDIETQKMELEQVVESRLILLKQQADSLREKQKNMAADYARTSARYLKIFDDINKELSNRIHQIDQPVFDFVKNVDEQNSRMLNTDLIQTAALFNKESSILQSQIKAAVVKKHALNAMSMAEKFLTEKACCEATLRHSNLPKYDHDTFYVPVCYMETLSENSNDQKCYINQKYNDCITDNVQNELSNNSLDKKSEYEENMIKTYFEKEVVSRIKSNDNHSSRVKEIIFKMFNK